MIVYNKGRHPVKAWHDGVHIDSNTIDQLTNLSDMPFIHKWVASMPDAHLGRGCAIGTVLATDKAIIPAAVGVDLGCGMQAVKTTLVASDLPEDLHDLRCDIESRVPVGKNGVKNMPSVNSLHWNRIANQFDAICTANPEAKLEKSNHSNHMGSLGGGNHFIELCIDENQDVWMMLHSGSRGVGNSIGRFFIEKAKEEMERFMIHLPDKDLSYLPEGSKYFNRYVQAVDWAQAFAKNNRDVMMYHALNSLREKTKPFQFDQMAIDCHHNYVQKENHYHKNVWVTRKGAVSARSGQLGIIPASMGERSMIVRGLGNEEAFCSCSHGAGRVMSRSKAKELISMEEHVASLDGVECRKDSGVLDESPRAYKDIDSVMSAQDDLVEIVHVLKQVMCIKG